MFTRLHLTVRCGLRSLSLLLLCSGQALGGGGVVLSKDACIITIGFYTAHFTAYQPRSRGNEEFCEDLPDTGESIFVLDYLHDSLKEVPVDFRIIRDATGLGQFAKWEDVQALENIGEHTVFYQPPLTRSDGSYRVSFEFAEKGDYLGVVTAGHPSKDSTYNSVFPFSVGSTRFPLWLAFVLVAVVFALLIRFAASARPASDATG